MSLAVEDYRAVATQMPRRHVANLLVSATLNFSSRYCLLAQMY